MSDSSKSEQPSKGRSFKTFLGKIKSLALSRKGKKVESKQPILVTPQEPETPSADPIPDVNPWQAFEKSLDALRFLSESTQLRMNELDSKLGTLLRGQVAWEDLQFQIKELTRSVGQYQETLQQSLKSQSDRVEQLKGDFHSWKKDAFRAMIGGAVGVVAILGLAGYAVSQIDRVRRNSNEKVAQVYQEVVELRSGMSVVGDIHTNVSEVAIQTGRLNQLTQDSMKKLLENGFNQEKSFEAESKELAARDEILTQLVERLSRSVGNPVNDDGSDSLRSMLLSVVEEMQSNQRRIKELVEQASDIGSQLASEENQRHLERRDWRELVSSKMDQERLDILEAIQAANRQGDKTKSQWISRVEIGLEALDAVDVSSLPVTLTEGAKAWGLAPVKLGVIPGKARLVDVRTDGVAGWGILQGESEGHKVFWLTKLPDTPDITGKLTLVLTIEP